MRSGHTEAAVDLCKLAGLPPVGVICELANDDGTVMVGPQIAAFAEKHKLKQISVADLIAFRQAREKLVWRVAEFPVRHAVRQIHGLRLCHAVRFGPAFRPGRRRDRRRPWTFPRACIAPTFSAMCSAAARRSMPRWKSFPDTDAACWSICATARPACRPISSASRRKTDTEKERAKQLARHRRRRADPARSRRVLDPAAHQGAAQICRAVGLRHRNHGHRRARLSADAGENARQGIAL